MSTSVRDLQIGEMISISAAWVGPQKATFLAVPQIAPLYDRVDTTHQALIVARDGATADATLGELNAKAEKLDDRHDNLSRGLHYSLLAAKYFELGRDGGDEAHAAAIDRASDALFPIGLRGVLATYQAEAGNAAQLNSLATNEFASVLSKVHVTKDMTALDVAHAIGAVGTELGAVEGQRVVAAADAKKDTITPAEVRRRMRDWAQVAEAVLMNLELSTASEQTIEALRRPLLDVVAKATARRREKRAKKEEGTGGT
ncbi:MAG: hypothetical protein IPM54_12650 [Polyangiaceae bacterium]|nr:hypothetical protein [Polyangiaceae bacterium]